MQRKSSFHNSEFSKTLVETKWTLDRSTGPLSKVASLENRFSEVDKSARDLSKNLRKALNELRENLSQTLMGREEGRKTSVQDEFSNLLRKIKTINTKRVECSTDVETFCDSLHEQLGHQIATAKEMQERNTMIQDLCQKDVLPNLLQVQKDVAGKLENFNRLNEIGSHAIDAFDAAIEVAMSNFKKKKERLSKKIFQFEKKVLELHASESKERVRIYQGLLAISSETAVKIDAVK